MNNPAPVTVDPLHVLNFVQGRAIDILNKAMFSHIEKINEEDYRALANSNSAKLNIPMANFFLYDGCIYPQTSPNGVPIRGVRVTAPPLHYSLIEQFDEIRKRVSAAGQNEFTNFFISVISISAHEMVLSEVLPTVLLNALKSGLPEGGFDLLNKGIPQLCMGPQVTKIALENLKDQWAPTIEKLRQTLMNQLLAVM